MRRGVLLVRHTILFSGGPLVLAVALGASSPGARREQPPAPAAPAVIALRPEALQRARALVAANDPRVEGAIAALLHDAERDLRAPVVAVTDKHTLMPPSGDPHDYYSLSPYWWPDPKKPDGLPYIRRDGVVNPESKRDLDQPRVARMGETVRDLSLAYYLSGDERFAAGAARQLRAWFLDAATHMNPNLRYAQLVRGNPNERGSGIIDTRWFIEAADAARLLRSSRAWTGNDEHALQQWFATYVDWLRTSPNGQHEHAARNNHGSWYAAQTATLALYAGDTATARALVEEGRARIGWQITATGEQPIEMQRTRSMHYSSFNLEALSRLAEVGRQLGIDLWHYEAPSGGSLRRGIDHLAGYMGTAERWPGPQIDPVDPSLLIIHLRRGDCAFGDTTYVPVLRRMPAREVRDDRSALLYPDSVILR